MLAGTVLGSQEPEQKRLSEGSRLAWISETAAGEKMRVSKPRVPRTCAMPRLNMLSGNTGWCGEMGKTHSLLTGYNALPTVPVLVRLPTSIPHLPAPSCFFKKKKCSDVSGLILLCNSILLLQPPSAGIISIHHHVSYHAPILQMRKVSAKDGRHGSSSCKAFAYSTMTLCRD